ncbi:MAG: DUF1295 domain-containing protein [Chloroflexota bacterium]
MAFLMQWMMGGLAIWCAMTLLWIISLLIRDSSIVDIFWGSGYVVVTVVWFMTTISNPIPLSQWLILALVSIWGLRLTIYLFWRNVGKGEDFRYQKWRSEHGKRWWWWSYIQVFLFQGAVMWFVAMPLLGAQFEATAGLNLVHYIGIFVWSVGLFFETVGDWQLAQFKANPDNEGKVLDTGLWKYTRHPNYFGDAVVWWGFYLLAVANGAWWTIFSPIVMTYLLMRISGVPMLERNMRKRKPDYADYVERTSAFLPMPPKKSA